MHSICGIRHMIKYHRDYERKSAIVTSWATLSNYQQGIFYMYHPTDRIAHNMAFVKPKSIKIHGLCRPNHYLGTALHKYNMFSASLLNKYLVHGLVACPCTPPPPKKTKLGGYFIVAWVPLVKKNDVNRKKPHSQGTCHAPF